MVIMVQLQNLQVDARNLLELPLEALVGESVAVLGIKGSGKTNTAAVLIEELLSCGLPLTIVDIEGEYWGLKEQFAILVAGRSQNVDLEVSAVHAGKIAEFSVTNGISVILDLSEFSQDEMNDFLLRYFRSLWETSFTLRRPYEIVLEEAHEFVPQSVRTPLKEILTRIALRGRKRGLGIISVSQRSAKVEKDVLTQASILFLHRVVHPIDIKVYQDILPLPSKEVENIIGNLRSGQAIVLNNHQVDVIQVRLRHTFHVGATPQLRASNVPRLRRVDLAMLENLKNLLSQVKTQENSLEKTIRELQDLVDEKDAKIEEQKATIERLRIQTELLSKLELSLGLASTEALLPSSKVNSLEVEQIHASQLVTAKSNHVSTPVEVLSLPDRLTLLQYGVGDPQEIQRQQRRFNSLAQDIKKLPKFQRSILRFLIEREGSEMGTKDLARWLDLSETTIKNRPPLDLMKLGLISRTRNKRSYKYISVHRTLLKAEFPDINTEFLIERLLASC